MNRVMALMHSYDPLAIGLGDFGKLETDYF